MFILFINYMEKFGILGFGRALQFNFILFGLDEFTVEHAVEDR